MGPTGSGKSDVAERLAREIGATLVNADAFQVYRGFDIGTNKPVRRDLYRLIDILEPTESFGVGKWMRLALDELEAAYASGKDVVVVGGTGLYVRALFESYSALAGAPDPALRARLSARLEEDGLGSLVCELKSMDPAAAERIDLRNPVRVTRAIERAMDRGRPAQAEAPPFRKFKFGLNSAVADLNKRLGERVVQMVEAGWLDEVRTILESGVPIGAPAMRAIGYHSMVEVVLGDAALDEAIQAVTQATRRYAKRQRTWLRAEPRLHQIDVDVFDARSIGRATDEILLNL